MQQVTLVGSHSNSLRGWGLGASTEEFVSFQISEVAASAVRAAQEVTGSSVMLVKVGDSPSRITLIDSGMRRKHMAIASIVGVLSLAVGFIIGQTVEAKSSRGLGDGWKQRVAPGRLISDVLIGKDQGGMGPMSVRKISRETGLEEVEVKKEMAKMRRKGHAEYSAGRWSLVL